MNAEVRELMDTAYHLVEYIKQVLPLIFTPFFLYLGWMIGDKITSIVRGNEKPKNDSFGYEDDKPKRLVLNEDGEIEGWE